MESRYLYRGKRIDNGEWAEGNLIQNSDAEDGWEAIIIPAKNSNMFTKHIKHGYGDLGYENWYRVDPATICQCTGLKDKNGKLIFENDIMEAHIDEDFPEDVSRFKVGWNGKGWIENHPDGVDREYLDDFDTEHFKVVGNIFDNPELLEV